MPILTTSVIRSPGKPRQSPPWMRSQKRCRRSSTARTSGGAPAPARSAMWRTARPSVWLIRSPANIFCFQPSMSAARASAWSRANVSVVIRCFEKSSSRPSWRREKAREASAISGEQFAQVERAHCLGVSRQGAPGRGIDDAHSQIISPGSNLWISAGCEGKMRIRYSSRPQLSGRQVDGVQRLAVAGHAFAAQRVMAGALAEVAAVAGAADQHLDGDVFRAQAVELHGDLEIQRLAEGEAALGGVEAMQAHAAARRREPGPSSRRRCGRRQNRRWRSGDRAWRPAHRTSWRTRRPCG